MLVIFAACAALMSARIVPALLAVPLMALATAAVAGAGPADLTSVVVDGTVKLAPVFVTVIFGAWLSRVAIATGIAETIVSYAAEFGGDRPALLALVLSAAVALLFTSLTGLGAIIMVGSIVLPIMMTIGIPRRTAATLFMLAFALGFIFNIAQWKFYTTTFGVERAQMQPYAFVLAGIDLLALLVFTFLRFRSARGYAQWALPAEEPVRARAPALALVTPLLPIALYFWLGLNPIVAFALAALFGALTAKPRAIVATLVAAAIRGVEDVAPAVVLFMGIGMLLVATGLPSVKAALAPVVTAIAPRNAFGYVALFGLLSPLALYRGPLNPFGVGIGVYTVLAGLGILPPATLVAAVMAVVQVQNVCDPTNTQNVWVANFTGVRVDEITRFTLPFQVAVATLATLVVALFGGSLLHAQPFAPAPASAAEPAPPGLFAPASAANTIAVAPADALSLPAAQSVFSVLAARWGGYDALWLDAPPAPSDCARKPYAALAVLRVTRLDAAAVPSRIDTELELDDCAGWPVDQWHVAGDLPPAGARGALARDGLSALERMQRWTIVQPELARSLFTRGLAYLPAGGPSYFYTLFKTIDGNMRAYVRAGGPAYVAGLRTNDVVEKLDGKYWWEYGTFATQQKAYDGLPHTFVINRGKRELTIVLGAPYGATSLLSGRGDAPGVVRRDQREAVASRFRAAGRAWGGVEAGTPRTVARLAGARRVHRRVGVVEVHFAAIGHRHANEARADARQTLRALHRRGRGREVVRLVHRPTASGPAVEVALRRVHRIPNMRLDVVEPAEPGLGRGRVHSENLELVVRVARRRRARDVVAEERAVDVDGRAGAAAEIVEVDVRGRARRAWIAVVRGADLQARVVRALGRRRVEVVALGLPGGGKGQLKRRARREDIVRRGQRDVARGWGQVDAGLSSVVVEVVTGGCPLGRVELPGCRVRPLRLSDARPVRVHQARGPDGRIKGLRLRGDLVGIGGQSGRARRRDPSTDAATRTARTQSDRCNESKDVS